MFFFITEIIKLRSPDSVTSQCHTHTTMSCKITSQDEPSISKFAWIGPGGATLCKLDERGGVVGLRAQALCLASPTPLFHRHRLTANSLPTTSDQTRQPAEFKHITKRRKRN